MSLFRQISRIQDSSLWPFSISAYVTNRQRVEFELEVYSQPPEVTKIECPKMVEVNEAFDCYVTYGNYITLGMRGIKKIESHNDTIEAIDYIPGKTWRSKVTSFNIILCFD